MFFNVNFYDRKKDELKIKNTYVRYLKSTHAIIRKQDDLAHASFKEKKKIKEKKHKKVTQISNLGLILRSKKVKNLIKNVYFLRQQHKLLKMSSGRRQEKIDELFKTFTNTNKKLQVRLFEKINKELESLLSKENNKNDSIDRVFDFLIQQSVSVQEEFD